MRAGDIVFHRPSREEWILAFADNGMVSPCGWPPTTVAESECLPVTDASDDEHIAMLRTWAAKSGDDHRIAVCRRRLEDLALEVNP